VVDARIKNPNTTTRVFARLPDQERSHSLVDVLFGDVNPSGCMLLAKVTLDMDHCSIQLSNLRPFGRTTTPRDCTLTIDTPSYEVSLLAVSLVTAYRIQSLCTVISAQPLQRLILGHSHQEEY
jgi:hypothetical protein